MSPELQQKFNKAFPILIGNCKLSVGDGWAPLLWDLFTKISAITSNDINESFDEPTTLEQVKEKFGGLRVYISMTNPEIYHLINQAEKRSYEICEDCGTEENVKCGSTGRLVATLCGKCREEFSKKVARSSSGKEIGLSSR
jgi:RNA polymerase-binding transcription factor DksA